MTWPYLENHVLYPTWAHTYTCTLVLASEKGLITDVSKVQSEKGKEIELKGSDITEISGLEFLIGKGVAN